MRTTLDTQPDELDVTMAQVDLWSFDYASILREGEEIDTASAFLISEASTPGRAVEGFVTDATVAGTAVNVFWTGAVLAVGGRYVLNTLAVLPTGQTLVFLTRVRCVGGAIPVEES